MIRLRPITPGTSPSRPAISTRCPASTSGREPPTVLEREQPVLVDVRDRDADLVDVPDDASGGALARPATRANDVPSVSRVTSRSRTPPRARACDGASWPDGPGAVSSSRRRSGTATRGAYAAVCRSRSREAQHGHRRKEQDVPTWVWIVIAIAAVVVLGRDRVERLQQPAPQRPAGPLRQRVRPDGRRCAEPARGRVGRSSERQKRRDELDDPAAGAVGPRPVRERVAQHPGEVRGRPGGRGRRRRSPDPAGDARRAATRSRTSTSAPTTSRSTIPR